MAQPSKVIGCTPAVHRRKSAIAQSRRIDLVVQTTYAYLRQLRHSDRLWSIEGPCFVRAIPGRPARTRTEKDTNVPQTGFP